MMLFSKEFLSEIEGRVQLERLDSELKELLKEKAGCYKKLEGRGGNSRKRLQKRLQHLEQLIKKNKKERMSWLA